MWCCVDKETEHYLARELGWSAVIAAAEERLNPIEADPAANDKTVRRKVHRAEREGVKVVEVDGMMDEEVKKKIEVRCKDWAAARKGTQIHLTGVRPFDDTIHRKYFYAMDNVGQVRFALSSTGFRILISFSDLCVGGSRSVIVQARFPDQVGSGIPGGATGSYRVYLDVCYQEVG